jgi:hypothetical protein
MQCILCKIYFWKVFHKYYNSICAPICTKFLFLQKVGVTSSMGDILYGALAIGAVLGCNSILNSVTLLGGIPGKSLGNTSENSWTIEYLVASTQPCDVMMSRCERS